MANHPTSGLQAARTSPGLESTWPEFPNMKRRKLETLQVNIGYRCNQSCTHCHVDAGPKRYEMMDLETIDLVLKFLQKESIETLDVTGGAPELNPHFRYLVSEARSAKVRVIDRCNLTVLEEPGQADLAEFLAEQGVHIISSLPCHTPENVDYQRGKGVFASSIRGLQRLNSAGYGLAETDLVLDLVFNPIGAQLPPDPVALEIEYKRQLSSFDVTFNRLLTLTNMPIKRFHHELTRTGQLDSYMRLLFEAHMPVNLEHIMCRSLMSVDWRGFVYDCDFNQMLGLPLGGSTKTHLRDLEAASVFGRPINVDSHCFGCTAGRGSSCSGALNA